MDSETLTTTESEDKMESGLLLDVVILESTSILKLLSSEDESLLIWRDALLVLDLGLHVLNGVALLNIESDGLSSKSLHEDLHTTTESEDEMESGFLLDVVVLESTSILKLLSSEDKSLLVWWDTFLVLDLCLDVFDSIRLFN